MNARNRIISTLALVVIALAVIAVSSNAAVVTLSTTAPTVDAADESNLVASTGDLKWFDDIEHDAGQTFTPGENAQINSFTIQVNRDNPDDGPDSVLVRLGTITRPEGVFTFTDIYSEMAMIGADMSAGDYITFTFDTPQILTGGVEYGIITDAQEMGTWQLGIPYLALGGTTYADGHAIGRGSPRPDDLVFHADMEAASSTLPDVDAGSDWVTWSGADVTLDDVVVVNNDVTDLTYAWSADPADGVVFDSNSIEFPTVTITKATTNPSVVTLTLAVNNVGSTNPDVLDSMEIDVYDDNCEAAKGVGTAIAFDPGDIDRNCITNLNDFAELAAAWLEDYTLTEPTVQ